MTIVDGNAKLYGLVDGAQYPESMATWVLEFSPEVRSLFEGLPEEEAGNAAPILFEIDDAKSEWVRQIDEMDRYRPCFTVVRSALSIDELKLHLKRFLFVDIGEGMQALIRWFDPRSLPSILEVWGKAAQAELTRPLTMWMYRGGRSEWQHVGIDVRTSAADAGEFPLSFRQQQLDELERHDEPHALMSELSDLGLIDGNQSYAKRFQDFLRRYNRAGEWGLTSRADRHAFCVASYQYGESFERHDEIRLAVRSSVASGAPLVQSFEMVPAYVWRELMRSLENKTALQEPGGGGMIVSIWKRFAALFVVGLLLTLAGCSDADESDPSDVSGYNYTDYYIAGFRVGNEGQDLWAGGPNIFPKRHGESRSGGGGGMCCISIPSKWRSGMKLVVKWRRDTHPYDDDRSGDQWYTATTEVPPYGPRTYGFWVHFLPGDRIRVEIQDKPPMPVKPAERDPYIVQGVLDPELNQK